MNEQLKDAFAALTMPRQTGQNILQAIQDKHSRPYRQSGSFGRRAAAMAAMLVLVLSLSPTVRAAVQELVEVIAFEHGITLYVEKDDTGSTTSVTTAYNTELPAWAQMREGRLYFLGHDQEIDITDQITEQEPYFYNYTDENGYKHIMAVGYSGELANYGIYEFIQEEDGTWVTGAGRNFLSTEKVGHCYPWVDILWEKLDIPWRKPGEDTEYAVSVTENEKGEAEQVVIEQE